MLRTDRFPLVDNVLVQIWRETKSGRRVLQSVQSTHNLITDVGRTQAVNRLIPGTAVAGVGFFALGIGVVTPITAGDTTLGNEQLRDTLTSTVVSSVGTITFQYFLNSSSGNGLAFVDMGLFDTITAHAGTMFARAALSPSIIKNSSKSVTFTWVITHTNV